MNELTALLGFEAVRQCVFQCVAVCIAVCVAVCVAACVAVLHLVFSVVQCVAVCYIPPNFDCGMQRFSIEAHVSIIGLKYTPLSRFYDKTEWKKRERDGNNGDEVNLGQR